MTWRDRAHRRRNIPDGNPPSGVASGYVWFDVMAMLVAPWLVALTGRLGRPRTPDAASDDLRAAAESL